MDEPILAVSKLKKYFAVKRDFFGRPAAWVKAVDGVSFHINRGETLGLVGESGCGKSTVGRAILHLHPPTAGEIRFDGQVIATAASVRQMRRRVQMVFQDPYASLNPRMTVGDLIGEPLDIHRLAAGVERQRRISSLLELVGLSAGHAARLPHEFSGGQRQRIGIARALAVEPALLICDEPVSSLDVSIQAQVINLLEDLREELNLAYLFIAHDLAVVKHISQRVAVMYMGKIMELAGSEELYARPRHPYTRELLAAIPLPDPELESTREPLAASAERPSPFAPPSGCPYHPRCPLALPLCRETEPVLLDDGSGHLTACHLADAQSPVRKEESL